MKVGYVRTSKKDQNPELRRRDLLAAGCEKFSEEQTSPRKEGDELVVWKLDRFGRSLR